MNVSKNAPINERGTVFLPYCLPQARWNRCSFHPSATEVKVSLGQTATKKNKNEKKKGNLTVAGEKSTGWFRSTWMWKIFTQLSHCKAKQSDRISRCRRNGAQHPFRSQTPRTTDMQTELSPEDTISHCAELSSQAQGSPTSSLAEQPAEGLARRRIGKTSTSRSGGWKKQYDGDWATAPRALQSCEMVSPALAGVRQYLGVEGRFPAVPRLSCCSTKKMPTILDLTGSVINQHLPSTLNHFVVLSQLQKSPRFYKIPKPLLNIQPVPSVCFWTGLFRRQAHGVLLGLGIILCQLSGWRLSLRWKISFPQSRKIHAAGPLKDRLLPPPKVPLVLHKERPAKAKFKQDQGMGWKKIASALRNSKLCGVFEAAWRTPLLNSVGLLADPGTLEEPQKPRAPSITGDWQTTLYRPPSRSALPACTASRPAQRGSAVGKELCFPLVWNCAACRRRKTKKFKDTTEPPLKRVFCPGEPFGV